MIEALRGHREPCGLWMFGLGPEIVPPDRIGYWWRTARAVAGIDLAWRPHDLRHWSATVAGRLGHANPAMTLRVYAHVFPAADQALAGSLGNILRDKT